MDGFESDIEEFYKDLVRVIISWQIKVLRNPGMHPVKVFQTVFKVW